jgi:hypothetical protein
MKFHIINDCHECPFYDALDSCRHRSENVMKHVSNSTNETKEVIGSLKSQADFDSVSKNEGRWNQWRNVSPWLKF